MLLEIGWLLTATLVPLWVNLWADQPFEPSKAALLRSLVWLVAGVWLIECLLRQKSPFRELQNNPLLWPVVGLGTVLLFSTLFAFDSRLSLFGSYTRSQGLLTRLSYPLLFLVVSARAKRLEQAERLLTVMVFTVLPLSLIGILQAMGMDPLGLVSDARSPLYATLGRANFVGAYLAMMLPLTLGLLLVKEERPWRLALFTLLVGQGAVIVLTLARGAWLAAGAGLSAFALLWFWPRLGSRQRRVVAGAGLPAAVTAVLGLGGWMVQARAGSVAARRTIWSAVWELLRERPWLGYGPDALEAVFPRVYPPELVYYQGRDVFVDRAHNFFLDWAVATGVIGTTVMLLVLAVFFLLAIGLYGKNNRVLEHSTSSSPAAGDSSTRVRQTLLIACLAAVVANLAGNMVSFDVTATAAASWLLMAVVVAPALQVGREGSSDQAKEIKMAATGPATLARAVMVVVPLTLVLLAIVTLNGRPLLAGVAHRTAVVQAANGACDRAVAAAQKAVDRWPLAAEHYNLLGRLHWRQVQQCGGDVRGVEWAEVAFLRARDLRPWDYSTWAALGAFYHQAGASIDPGALPLAHGAYRQAAELAPNNARLYVAWGQVYLAQERPHAAMQRFERALALDATDGLAYRLRGDVALAQGDPGGALHAYRQAARWSPNSVLAHVGLARSYAALGQPEQAVPALERAAELNPQHPAVELARREITSGIDSNQLEKGDDDED